MQPAIPILLLAKMKLHFVSIILVLSASIAADQVSLQGCPDQCGGIKIPFPFGTQLGCYLNNDTRYLIQCNPNPKPTPFLNIMYTSKHELLEINVDDHSIRILSGVAYQCYNNNVPIPSTDNSTYILDIIQYNLSSTRNSFVAIGCDTTARVWDSESTGVDLTGCMTSCLSLDSVTNGTCSGRGCCQTSISNTMSGPRIQVGSFNNHTMVQSFNPCSFAFVGEIGSFHFSLANLTAPVGDYPMIRVPVVYDWSIMSSSSGNCSRAKNAGNGDYICGSNTVCVDGSGKDGYRCQCQEGFTGNPYLSQGCQDIDECRNGSLNQCQKNEFCVNTFGGYECKCPKGFDGNGTMFSPCVAQRGSLKIILGLSISLGSIIGFLLLAGLYKLLRRRKEIKEREHNFRRNGGLLLQQEMSTSEGAIERTRIFSRRELERATDNFNDNRVLGRGGQGTVYKGMLEDGTIVAVKKSMKVDENQLAQFINEVVILSQINHRNVVKIFGCCLETDVPLLVYEFVPNGTLYQHIHSPTEDFHITWKMRFQIALECAGALAYLHSSSSTPIFHRDIKSSNILLDEKYRAKIADFGTSKTVSIDQTHVTTCVQGTFGYLDPEFFQSNQFTEKSDVYSFGVVLLELLTSKKPISTDTSKESRSLAAEFLQLMESPDMLHEILDNKVLHECSKEEIEALANLTKRCLSLNGKQRPTMREVAMTLEMTRPQHDVANNFPIEREEGNLWMKNMTMVDGGLFSTTSTGSASTLNSYSMDVQPLLFSSPDQRRSR